MSSIRSASVCLLGLTLLTLCVNSVRAAVYKCEDDAGNIIFSDEPCKKGQSGSKLRWLKNTHSGKKIPKKNVVTVEQKTARKAKKNNEAYVLLSLLTTTKLELETKTLRCSLDGEQSDRPELLLSDGITVDLLDVDKMLISYKLGEEQLKVHFIMHDGYEETRIINKPFPVISGDARLGSFSKSLEDIKQIEFFNSKKLRKLRKKQDRIARRKPKKQNKKILNKSIPEQEEVPVVELDLSHEVVADTKNNSVAAPKIKVVPKNKQPPKPLIASVQGERLPVVFANDKTAFLKRGTLSSRKGDKSAPQGYFLLSNKEQIPYTDIKSIRVRPTGNENSLAVAVALKSGEIKMQKMSRPFTRILGRSDKGRFEHSLLEIKSISF